MKVSAVKVLLTHALEGELGPTASWLEILWAGMPDYRVLMRLGRASDGRAVCSGLLLGGTIPKEFGSASFTVKTAEISAGSLRRIPLGEILDEVSRKKDTWSLSRLPKFQRPTRRGPKGIPRERLAEVAALYRRALVERPSKPVKWLSQQIHGPEGRPTPETTVRRWLQRCRDLGLLGASIPGKAGEQPKLRRKKR